MNNKELLTELSSRCGISQKEADERLRGLIAEITSQLTEGDTVTISGFGSFEVRKKMERVIVNAATKQKMLVPPKLVVNFKQSSILKNKINSKA